MISLDKNELFSINGGQVGSPVPVVSDNPLAQNSYAFGYRIGRAVGDAAANVLNLVESVGDAVLGWFD